MKRWQIASLVIGLSLGAIGLIAIKVELSTSRLQARYFSQIAKELTYKLEPGPSSSIRFPEQGPYDLRLGYSKIPSIVRKMAPNYFRIEAQARISAAMRDVIDAGFYPPYHEKIRAGLTIYDRKGREIYSALRPQRVYNSFEDIPELALRSLLFIENREILSDDQPYKNPAVEWDRLARAILEKSFQLINPSHNAPGGSTIATQLEKYLHSPEGRTASARDKLVQMTSASYRAYLDGDETIETRKKIVLKYFNSIPLAALPGYGEVSGLGDGMWAWYGREFDDFNSVLRDDSRTVAERAIAFKQVLSLFIAHRRPSYYLLHGSADLNRLTNEHLALLASGGVIPSELKDAALPIEIKRQTKAPPQSPISFVERKASNAIRTRLLEVLDIPRLYDLDNVDLTVESTIDKEIHDAISDTLASIKNRKEAEKYNLLADRILARGNPASVIFSFTLYERSGNTNVLRVQTDNLDRPFDINEGTRLDLGSTAKLRTLVSYLQTIEDSYLSVAGRSQAERRQILGRYRDVISQWVLSYLNGNPQASLKDVLEASMERMYSASPAETFFTGGGNHTFENFNKDDNARVVSVREAIRKSINLPFIRIMRDVVKYHSARVTGSVKAAGQEENISEEQIRMRYLARFADREGTYFLRGFYQRYKGLSGEELLARFMREFRANPKRLTVLFRFLYPDAAEDQLGAFLAVHLKRSAPHGSSLTTLYRGYDPASFSLNDKGFLLKVHPLELWLVGYLMTHPNATFDEATQASAAQRQEVYQWLFRSKSKRAQDSRIRQLIEADAFDIILRSWQQLGYPFRNIVPSYASSIGSSGDRPAALATLVGIILNGGMRFPEIRIERLHLAKDTPFETILSRDDKPLGERVLSSEVAAVAKAALEDVVARGTAQRVHNAILDVDGNALVVGGKTGTGDHRFERYGAGGKLISSTVVSRTATFAFFIGDRFYGVITAHVKGPEAAKFNFTSALAAELLKGLGPSLRPLLTKYDVGGGGYANLTSPESILAINPGNVLSTSSRISPRIRAQ